MAVSPGTYNVTIQRASDWSVILQFKDSTDTAINLTIPFTHSIRTKRDLQNMPIYSCLYRPQQRQVTISLIDTQTATFIDELYYDVLLENASGLREYYLKALFLCLRGTPGHDSSQCHNNANNSC